MRGQNLILKYKLATYKAKIIIVIMIHLHSLNLKYRVQLGSKRRGEIPVSDLANHSLMNKNRKSNKL